MFVSWMAIAGTGPGKSVELAQNADTASAIFFGPVRHYYGNWAITLFNILLVTGSFACGMAFHNCASRYIYALGREGLSKRSRRPSAQRIPCTARRTSRRSCRPASRW